MQGGLKLYLSKADRLNEETGALVGTVVQVLVSNRLGPEEHCLQRHCQVIDVFGAECYEAPTAIVRRRREIQAACREIRERWEGI